MIHKAGRASRAAFRQADDEAFGAQQNGSMSKSMPTAVEAITGQNWQSIFVPKVNCCEVAHADRAAVLVDGANYFSHLEATLRRARHSIFIVGWDFDGRIRLRADQPADISPPLGALLRGLVEDRPELHVYILVWSVSVIHGPSATAPALLGSPWQDHPRIHMKLDTRHPLYAAHHQKIVCIDGRVAFSGGIDLTVRRWDRNSHRADDGERVDLDGTIYPPVHDIQMIVDAEAAAVLCRMAAERWSDATGEKPSSTAGKNDDIWPRQLPVQFRDVSVAIARTSPAYGGRAEISEIGTLTLDMIAAARTSIYIEAQYMTAPAVGDALAARLREPDGPEIMVVMTHTSKGLIERFAMASNRDRLIRRLAKADGHDRLRVVYPVVPSPQGQTQVLVHAKLIIIDDTLLRVGSANLNNRSIALDTECDLAIEARNEADRAAIAEIRNRLLAEHLDCAEADMAETIATEGGLIAAVDRLNVKMRGLRPFSAMRSPGPTRPIFGTSIFDPVRPFRLSLPFVSRGRSGAWRAPEKEL
ncbi:phospholipase D-like domain-containing protein [Bosea sp. RCC_152_1]|uniref:phospholipase D-like domain-containing protein n=1 Tax=Bosea sp. RCC_152_1 TaxID=3239228 RepID=UPI003526033C